MTTTYAEPDYVQENRQKRALASGRPQPCGEGTGGGLTCRAFPTRLYTSGWRCSSHEPQPVNPVPDPARTVDGLRAAGSNVLPAPVRAIRAQFPGDVETTPTSRIDERFRAFDQANPHVRARLIELIETAVSQGQTRIGAGALFEQLRYAERTETNGDRYALNNDFRAPYVRALIAERPEWADLFELRQRRSA